MKYEIGQEVEVRLSKDAPWFEGIVRGIDDEHYIIQLTTAQLLSTLFKQRIKRDLKTESVNIKKHLETVGLGHLHMRLKNPKSFTPK